MSSSTSPAAVTSGGSAGRAAGQSDLIGARLPKWALPVAAAGAVAVALGLKLLFDWSGWYTAFFTAAAAVSYTHLTLPTKRIV